jgi:PIN domain nuclease of toxin-antitoxin system
VNIGSTHEDDVHLKGWSSLDPGQDPAPVANLARGPRGPGHRDPDQADPRRSHRSRDWLTRGSQTSERRAAVAESRRGVGRRRQPEGPTLTVLDSQAIIAALIGEPAAREVEALLRDSADAPRVSATNLAEILDVLIRHQGWPADDVEEKLGWLMVGGLDVVVLDERIALSAGRIHARHYHRTRRPLSLADCAALATALALGQRLATSDPALIAAAADEGCEAIALLDSRGRRPTTADEASHG